MDPFSKGMNENASRWTDEKAWRERGLQIEVDKLFDLLKPKVSAVGWLCRKMPDRVDIVDKNGWPSDFFVRPWRGVQVCWDVHAGESSHLCKTEDELFYQVGRHVGIFINDARMREEREAAQSAAKQAAMAAEAAKQQVAAKKDREAKAARRNVILGAGAVGAAIYTLVQYLSNRR